MTKKLSTYFMSLMAIAGVLAFSSCTEEEKAAPTVKINTNSLGSNQSAGTAAPGAPVTINYTANAEGELKSINVTTSLGNTETSLTGYPKTSNFSSSKSHTDNVIVNAPTTGSTTVRITATDKDGKTGSVSFVITSDANVGLRTWNDVYLYTQNAQGPAVTGDKVASFLNTTTGAKNTRTEISSLAATVQAQFDITLGEAASTSWFINPTARGNFSLVNADGATSTKFDAYTGTFASVTSTTLAALTAPTSDNVSVLNSAVVAFKNNAGKNGVIAVTAQDGTSTTPTWVRMNIKVQQ